MHEEISVSTAKAKLPEILRRVEKGEAFTITNRGRSVADLVPSKGDHQPAITAAIEGLLKSEKHPTPDSVLLEIKGRGRR